MGGYQGFYMRVKGVLLWLKGKIEECYWVLQRCYRGIIRVVKRQYWGVTELLLLGVFKVVLGCHRAVKYLLQGCYRGVTKLLQKCYKGVAEFLQGYYTHLYPIQPWPRSCWPSS